MMRALQFVATLAAALFAGAALYINIAEHPARMALDTLTAASQWAPSYKRATWLQAPLAAISCLCGAAVWWLDGGTGWLVAALLIGAVVPFTLIVIMPTNKQLLERGRDLASAETRDLLGRWARLHAVRTVLSLLAAGLFVSLLLPG
jgi:Anthrone oxygenase